MKRESGSTEAWLAGWRERGQEPLAWLGARLRYTASAGRPRRLPCSRVLREAPGNAVCATKVVPSTRRNSQGPSGRRAAASELGPAGSLWALHAGGVSPESPAVAEGRSNNNRERSERKCECWRATASRALGALARSDGAAAG
eukprot:scaffold24708_cov101-Isochrysis_galbana.AAC.2